MLKELKGRLIRLLPKKARQTIADLLKAPGEIVVNMSTNLEQMLNASPLGQAALEDLLNDNKKHLGSTKRDDDTVVEISDTRLDWLNPIRPDDVRALAATHLAQSTDLNGRVRIRFTPKPPQR